MQERKSTHPWVNEAVEKLVQKKQTAVGTEEIRAASKACSEGLNKEFAKYVQAERERLQTEPKSSKGWWSMTRRLLSQKGRTCSIPALKKPGGEWCMDAKGKAEHLADTFQSKYKLADRETNYYTKLEGAFYQQQGPLNEVTEDSAVKVLSGLRGDSATGPDELPAKILSECSKQLAKPFCILANLILKQARWPELWIEHWIIPLHKKLSVYNAANYRGVHLTTQLSKAMERLLQCLYLPFVTKHCMFGYNQFAYTTERGARDAIAYMVLKWITAMAKGSKVGVYCSDVSGAFDRVDKERLLEKLRKKKLHPTMISVFESWLRNRKAKVLVGGQASKVFKLANMIFQGTVWGPTLWNLFYEDARLAVQEMSFSEVVFADDLNACRTFPSTMPNSKVFESTKLCQQELHSWGRANQVSFDPGKESFHILSTSEGSGKDFKLLGVIFDVLLEMDKAVDEVVMAAGWKLKMLIRTWRFYTDAELIRLYKAHLLSYLEYRTSAIYHAKRKVLEKLDRVQSRFLGDVGVDDNTALLEFSLAPLEARRDIAMLGVIHRTVRGKGPRHFKDYFKLDNNGNLVDPRRTVGGELVKRSALGLVAIYNLLPERCKRAKQVKDFQRELQNMLKSRAAAGCEDWQKTFSPRISLQRHPLAQD
jgi:hypothetical protein